MGSLLIKNTAAVSINVLKIMYCICVSYIHFTLVMSLECIPQWSGLVGVNFFYNNRHYYPVGFQFIA